MPALSNPRHEAFAQAIFAGLGGKTRQERANSTAYLTAYPGSTAPGSAKASAARLLTRVSPILDRVRELQAEQAAKTQRKIDISRERLARDLDEAANIARKQENAGAMVSSALAIAKILGLETGGQEYKPTDFSQAQSMREIGEKLLQSIGMEKPDDASIELAIQANNAFVARLEAIGAAADGTIDED